MIYWAHTQHCTHYDTVNSPLCTKSMAEKRQSSLYAHWRAWITYSEWGDMNHSFTFFSQKVPIATNQNGTIGLAHQSFRIIFVFNKTDWKTLKIKTHKPLYANISHNLKLSRSLILCLTNFNIFLLFLLMGYNLKCSTSINFCVKSKTYFFGIQRGFLFE